MTSHSRPSLDEYMLKMAVLAASRGTCVRRQVGCILINKYGHIIGTGYNGVPAGDEHCIDKPCAGAGLPSGTGLDKCGAIHAEQNALLQCKDVMEIETAYCTHSPCVTCVKLLRNTGCKRIVYLNEYAHSESKQIWLAKEGNVWLKGAI